MAHKTPTRGEVIEHLRTTRNWNRWGADDQRGTWNLVTAEKRVKAAGLVQSGRSVSLSRPWPTEPAPGNAYPAQHFMQRFDKPGGAGLAEDFIGAAFHGKTVTHLDALCHTWDSDGMWNGRTPSEEIGFAGARWGSVDAWSDGLVTRGVLLDVPRYRGAPFVTIESPVHGWELEEVAASQGTQVGPGDAVLVYSGREAWDRAEDAWAGLTERPGLDASCLWFLREHDCSALVWDMTDRMPNGYELPFGVHNAIHAYGLALIDMALLEPLSVACAEEGRWEFMFVVSPLPIKGGTGSPVNPLAVF